MTSIWTFFLTLDQISKLTSPLLVSVWPSVVCDPTGLFMFFVFFSTSVLEICNNLIMLLNIPFTMLEHSRAYNLSNLMSIPLLTGVFTTVTQWKSSWLLFASPCCFATPRNSTELLMLQKTWGFLTVNYAPVTNTVIMWQWLRLNEKKGAEAVSALEGCPKLLVEQVPLRASLSRPGLTAVKWHDDWRMWPY